MKGMSEVTAEGGTAATTFADYPIKVGGKTGSAEMTERKDGVEINYTNGLFVAFAPFDDRKSSFASSVKVRDTVPRSRRSCVIFWMRTSQRKSRIRWSLCRVKTRWFLDRMFQCNKNFAQMLVN